MTIKEVIFELQNLLTKIKEARQILHLDKKQEEMRVLEMQMSASDFWVNALEAGKITQKYDELKKEFDFWHDLESQARDLQEMAELDAKDKTVSLREDLERQLI